MPFAPPSAGSDPSRHDAALVARIRHGDVAAFETVFRGTSVQIGVVPAADSQGNPRSWWRSSYDRHYVLYEWAASVKSRFEHGIPMVRD